MIQLQHSNSGRLIETDDEAQALVWQKSGWVVVDENLERDPVTGLAPAHTPTLPTDGDAPTADGDAVPSANPDPSAPEA